MQLDLNFFSMKCLVDPCLSFRPWGLSWPWTYGSCIYICNLILSPLMLWVWMPLRMRCTTLCEIKFVSDLWQVGGFLRFPPLKNWPPRYNWNMVESGVLNHKAKPNLLSFLFWPFYFLSFDLQHLITLLVSSIFSTSMIVQYNLVKPPPSVQPDFGVITSLAINWVRTENRKSTVWF